MEFKLTCGSNVIIDDEDFDMLPKTGWYLQRKEKHNSGTDYVIHDSYSFMHRYILSKHGIDLHGKVVDHINRNGLDNRKNNLRIVDTSINKKNQNPIKNNQFNFNGIYLEYNKSKDYLRFRVSWNKEKYKQRTKTFSFNKFDSPKSCLKEAILFRISKMKEFDYILDERSTTIEKELKNNSDVEKLLNIDLNKLILDKIGSSESKWRVSLKG